MPSSPVWPAAAADAMGNGEESDVWEAIEDSNSPGVASSEAQGLGLRRPAERHPTHHHHQHHPQKLQGLGNTAPCDEGAESCSRPGVGTSVRRFFASPRTDGGSGGGGTIFGRRPRKSTAAASPHERSRTSSYRRLSAEMPYTTLSHRHRGASVGGYSHLPSQFVSSTMSLAQLGSTGPLSTHLLDWRVPSLSAEQELLQHVFATAYTDACYRCLIAQDASTSFGPNETLQLVVDQWRADAFDESQDTLRRVVEQYHHDLLQVVKSVVDAEDAALTGLATETVGAEENMAAMSMNASMSTPAPINTAASASSDTSFYQAFVSVGQANIPAMIDCAAAQKAVLHYAMPALGRVMVHQGFFLCFWYSSTGEKIGQLEYRACRWVLEAHVPHVHVPLCYHFRYKGRGVTAMSLTPIGETLTTVTEQNPEVAALAQQLASVFSLLPYGSSPGHVGASASGGASATAAATTAATNPFTGSPITTTEDSAAPFSSASFASMSAASVDGEVMPDINFLPRSVRVHFAQDGRYYFLRNSLWFTPWLNSRQSCDAAAQRLSYVNPRLLAVCGVQVSCRACQRDAFLEENRVALEFMRNEVDFGIPRLLRDEQGFFVQQLLRRRRRAAARRLQAQRTARAADEAEAAQGATRVRVGEGGAPSQLRNEGDGIEEREASLLFSRSSASGNTDGADADADWAEVVDEGEKRSGQGDDADGSEDGTVDPYGGHHRHRSRRSTPTALLPFTTTSVVRRFSARGYPKSLLGVLLLALLQYPAAPVHMVREVKREILFRGLKAFIRTRTYEARFGVEQLLGRLPHERVHEEDIAAPFIDDSDRFSEAEGEGEEEPIHEELANMSGAHYPVISTSVHNSGSNPSLSEWEGSAVAHSGARRPSQERTNHLTSNSTNSNINHMGHSAAAPRPRIGSSSIQLGSEVGEADGPVLSPTSRRGPRANPLHHVSVVAPRHRDGTGAEAGGAGSGDGVSVSATRPSFAQRWQQRSERRQGPRAADAHPRNGDTITMESDSSERQGMWGRLRRGISRLRSGWFGGVDVDAATAPPTSARSLPGAGSAHTAHEGPAHASPSSQHGPRRHNPSQTGVGVQNPLAATPSTNTGGDAGVTSEKQRPAASQSGLSSSSLNDRVTATPPPATTLFPAWTDFTVTTERVLTAFMQYDGTARPSHVFCDSPRRLHDLHEAREKARAAAAAANSDHLSDSFVDEMQRSAVGQQRALEAALWSSADMLNRMYVEQILPFTYRKFRLSLRRATVLHDPLCEEDRAIVYVRLLDALGLSVEDGEVQQAIPIVMDFAPLRAGGSTDAAMRENNASEASNNPPAPSVERHVDGGVDGDRGDVNPLQRHGSGSATTSASASASVLHRAPTPGAAASMLEGLSDHNGEGGQRRGKPSLARAAQRHTSRPDGGRDDVSDDKRTERTPAANAGDGGQRRAAQDGKTVPASRSHATKPSPSPEQPTLPSGTVAVRPHYRLPSWIVWRAKGLVQDFLARSWDCTDGYCADLSGRRQHPHRHRGGSHRRASSAPAAVRPVYEAAVSVGSAQVAGLVPLLGLFYNTPLTAFASDPRRPPLPQWPHVAARLLAQLRAVSVTPHLLWDALELYELVDQRTLKHEFRADRTFSLTGTGAAPTAPMRRHSPLALGGGEGSDSEETVAMEEDEEEKEGHETSSRASDTASQSTATATRTQTSSIGSNPLPMMTLNELLPAPCCALALALLLRRRTLRSTSDRSILIQVLRRYVAAIRDFPEVLCLLDPLHGRGDRATPEVMRQYGEDGVGGRVGSFGEQSEAAGREAATRSDVESEAVYTAVLSTLQEVLLNSDLLLAQFGNPFGAQYRQYTADLVGYLEYNQQSIAAAAAAARSKAHKQGVRAYTATRPPMSGLYTGEEGSAQAASEDMRQRLRGLREELDSTLKHIWKHLLTYCKPDSASAKDAMQHAVGLIRLQKATAAAAAVREGGGKSFRSSHANSAGNNNNNNSSFSSSIGRTGTVDPVLALSRDPEVESALQLACDMFLATEGTSSPVTMRAYSNMAMYWYCVGCEAEWREWMLRLRRLWREGGPEDIRQLLMATSTLGNYSLGGGAGGPSSRMVGGQSVHRVGPPLPFIYPVRYD